MNKSLLGRCPQTNALVRASRDWRFAHLFNSLLDERGNDEERQHGRQEEEGGARLALGPASGSRSVQRCPGYGRGGGATASGQGPVESHDRRDAHRDEPDCEERKEDRHRQDPTWAGRRAGWRGRVRVR